MAGDEEQPKKNPSWITRLFSDPVYSWVASFVGGAVLSACFFYASREVPDLTYYVSPTRTAILTGGQNQKLSVSYAEQPVHGDISSAQVTIWNAGRKAITRSDLLTVPTLAADNPILDEKVLDESRPLIGFTVDNSNAARGTLALGWRILEHNDGVKLQIIYAGEPGARIVLDGAIIGQHAPLKRSGPSGDLPHSTLAKVGFLIGATAVVCLFGFNLIRLIVTAYRNRNNASLSSSDRVGFAIAGTLALCALGAVFAIAWQAFYRDFLNIPPFGF